MKLASAAAGSDGPVDLQKAKADPERLSGLDGLRAISVCLVVASHLAYVYGQTLPRWAKAAAQQGELGVRVFFVISGFLITGILLRDIQRNGKVQFGRFYFRRSMRIFPPFYIFLAFVAIAFSTGLLGKSSMLPGIVPSALYVSNYWSPEYWYLGHTWSLSVEEQFYLLWPLALSLSRPKPAARLLMAMLVLAPAARTMYESFDLAPLGMTLLSGRTFESAADALALGCLVAIFRADIEASPRWKSLSNPRWLTAAAIVTLVFLEALRMKGGWFFALHGAALQTVQNVLIAVVVLKSVTTASDWLRSTLNSRLMVSIGVASYSIYLWQQVLIAPSLEGDPLFALPSCIGLLIAVPAGAYLIVEKSSFAVRRLLEAKIFVSPPKTPEHGSLPDLTSTED